MNGTTISSEYLNDVFSERNETNLCLPSVSNNRPFLVVRWEATQEQCRRIYSSADYRQVQNYSNPGKLGQYLRRCETEHCPDVLQKNKVLEVQEAVSTYKQLADRISGAIHPESLDLAIVWGPIALVIRVNLTLHNNINSFF